MPYYNIGAPDGIFMKIGSPKAPLRLKHKFLHISRPFSCIFNGKFSKKIAFGKKMLWFQKLRSDRLVVDGQGGGGTLIVLNKKRIK